MACKKDQAPIARLLELAAKQHGAVARRQLLAIGYTRSAIEAALAGGRLHRTEWRGVYAVGRPDLTRHGRLTSAVLSCGPEAVLSHASAGDLWGIRPRRGREVHVSVPAGGQRRRRRGVVVHRRSLSRRDMTRTWGIPVTTPIRTLLDLAAATRDRHRVERDIDQAHARNLLKVEALVREIDAARGQPGAPLMRAIVDRDLFVLTDSELERLFVPIARRAGLERPHSQVRVNGHRVDFHFPSIDLVVECDSLRYHRTAFEQRQDRLRDQAHDAAGTPYTRYTHWQIAKEARYVERHLVKVAARLRPPARRPGPPRAA
jgi:very-short-patch-repair endonuclease